MMRLNRFESVFEYDLSYNCTETSSRWGLAVVELLVVMASDVSDPEVMKQDRPGTSRSKSRTQPVSSPSMNQCRDDSTQQGRRDQFAPPRSRNPSRDVKTLGPVTDTARDDCSPSLELTTLTALLLSPGSFVPLITFFFLSPQVISACFDLLDGVLQ